MNITEEAEYFIELPAKQNKLYVNYDIEENISIDAFRVTRFTEAEIKAIDERYWPFAVPAEEVEKKPKYIVKIGKLYLKEPLGDTSNFTILTTWDKKCAYPFSSFHMADIHAAKFEGTVEEVTEG
ncbi:DUF1642 domain-containing protein [Enterococcus lactis]|nr:DUF1642 domain-containing protein [Enterococcus lactis]